MRENRTKVGAERGKGKKKRSRVERRRDETEGEEKSEVKKN